MINTNFRKNYTEARRSPRIQENLPILWKLRDDSVTHHGRVVNINGSGFLMETNTFVPPSEDCRLSFDGVENGILPSQGRLVWSKKKGLSSTAYHLGVEFVEPAQEVVTKLHERIKTKVLKIQSAERLRDNIGGVLIFILTGILSYLLIQYFMIQGNYEASTKILLVSSNRQASNYSVVAGQLSETRTILTETQALLQQAKTDNALLQNQLQSANANVEALTEQNTKLVKELADLELRLKPFEGQVSTINEGRAWKQLVKNRIKDIKIGISEVEKKAKIAREAAKKEKDRVLLALGNQGFLVKDSKPVSNNFNKNAELEKKVKITVDLVE